LACAREAGDPWYTAYGQFNLGYVASLLGDHAGGYAQMLAGLTVWRALGDSHYVALGLNYISPTASQLGRHGEAEAFLEEGLALSTQLGDRWGMGTAYRNLGLVALNQGMIDRAYILLHKGLETFEGIVSGWDIAKSLVYLGQAKTAAGDLLGARRNFEEALHEAMEAQTALLAMDALVGLACLHARGGEEEQALRLSIYVLSHPASAHHTRDQARQLCQQLELRVAPEQVDRAYTWARTIELETLAIELVDAPHQAEPSDSCGQTRRPPL
jgi:tetratricopeptide (TPR) repeat protein